MNSENSKASYINRLLLGLINKKNLRRGERSVALSNVSNYKAHIKTMTS